jgi:hypothetical protein
VKASGSSTARTLAARAADTVEARDETTLALAIARANSTGAVLIIRDATTITTALGTITAPVRFEGAGKLVLNTGGSVTLSGAMEAGLIQIFDTSGGGTLGFNARVREIVPQWWGAHSTLEPGYSSFDSTVAIQASIDASRGKRLHIPQGVYLTSSALVIPCQAGPSGSLGSLGFHLFGDGYDLNGGTIGTTIKNVGAADAFTVTNPAGGSSDTRIVISEIMIVGDGVNASGGDGINATLSNGLRVRGVFITGMRGFGVHLTNCWSAMVEDSFVFSNRRSGVKIDGSFNSGVIRDVRATGNGKIYSEEHAGIWISGADSMGARVDMVDVSYGGSGAYSSWKRSDGTLVSVAVAANVATITTSTAHGLAAGNKFSILGGVADGLKGTQVLTIASTPTGTTFTAPLTAANGTYTGSALSITPAVSGIFASNAPGLKINNPYCEDTSANGMYLGSGVRGFAVSGGLMWGSMLAVDGAVSGSISGVHLNQTGSYAGLMVSTGGRTGVNVSGNSFAGGASLSLPTYYRPDGTEPPVAGLVSLPYAASIPVDARLGGPFTVYVTDANAFAIGAPSNPTDGQEIEFILLNNTGGAINASNPWNAAYHLAAATWVQPATFHWNVVKFIYVTSGLNGWLEVSRAVND